MKPSELLKLVDFPSILVFSPAGAGKTALVTQAQKAYMFDFDAGWKTMTSIHDKFYDARMNNIDVDIYLDRVPTKPTMWIAARKKAQELVNQSASGRLPVEFIIVDSLTGAAKALRLEIMSRSGDVFKVPQIQHWGYMVNELEAFLTLLRSVKAVKLFTAHEQVRETTQPDGKTLDKIVTEIFPRSITKPHSINEISWRFDEVWYCKVKPAAQNKNHYIVSGRSSDVIKCRTRTGLDYDLVHNDIGLKGVLEKIQYKCKEKE